MIPMLIEWYLNIYISVTYFVELSTFEPEQASE